LLFVLGVFLGTSFVFASAADAGEARFLVGHSTYWVDGEAKPMDVAPFIRDGRTYVPLRYAAYAVGAGAENVLYHEGRATIIKGDRVLVVMVGSRSMLVNGIEIRVDAGPFLLEGRIMVPIRWVAVGMGVTVEWDDALDTVILTFARDGADSSGEDERPPLFSVDKLAPVSPVEPAARELRAVRWVLPEEAVLSREFTWEHEGVWWRWRIDIPQETYAYYAGLERAPTDDYSIYATDSADDFLISVLAARFAETASAWGCSPAETIDFVAAFAQGIRYRQDDASKGVKEYPRFPVETLVDGEGDCEDKSVLLGAILQEMGYDAVLLMLTEENHMAVGVGGVELTGTYYAYEGSRYYYLEASRPGWAVGEIPEETRASTRILPLVPKPVLTHEWSSKGVWGGLLELTVRVRNYGSATARNTKVYAALDAGSGLVYDQVWSRPLDLAPRNEGTFTLFLQLPRSGYTRLLVKVVADGCLMDESTSEWFGS